MQYSKLFVVVLTIFIFATGCKQGQEARRPIAQTSGTFMKKSAERNKKLIANEEDQIAFVIKNNPKTKFLQSKNGYWYGYITQNKIDTLLPKKGDAAFFEYDVKDFKGNVIYSTKDLKQQTYMVDKQNIMTGLREGIKLMHKKEKVVFLFPSHIAYGYHGDDKKIGTNQPLLCTVTLHNFMPETAFKKELAIKKLNTKELQNDSSDRQTTQPIDTVSK